MKIKKFRSDPTYQEKGTPKVDRESGAIYGVSAMQIGPALGHGSYCDEATIGAIESLGNESPKGVKVRFTHPGMCADGLGKMLGRIRNFRVVDDKAVGDFYAGKYAKPDLLEHIYTFAEEDPESFGMSVVILADEVYKTPNGEVSAYKDNEPADAEKDEDGIAKLYIRPQELRAVDFVDEPAANRDGLFSEAFDGTSNGSASDAYAMLDQLIDNYSLDAEQVQAFIGRYFTSREGTQPEQPPAASAAANDEGVLMDIKDVQALAAAHPASADVILSLAAEGKTEAEINSHLHGVELSQAIERADNLQAQLDKANEKFSALEAEKADLQAAHDALKALQAPNDPGPDGHEGESISLSDFNAMTGKARAEYLAAGGTIDEGAK